MAFDDRGNAIGTIELSIRAYVFFFFLPSAALTSR